MRSIPLLLTLALLIGAGLSACTDEETVFNEIDTLRVLGIRASKPWLREGDTTTLDFLAENNDPDIDDARLASRWYFCPVQADSTFGFACFVQSPDDLETVTGTVALPPVFDEDDFSEFGLLVGTGATVELPYLFPAETLADTCETLDDIDLPPFVTRPSCNGRFPVTIYLEFGEDTNPNDDEIVINPDRRIVAFRDLQLVYDVAQEPDINQNPEINSVSIARRDRQSDAEFRALPPDEATTLRFETNYDLRVDVDLEQSEMITPEDDDVPDRESLTITWFVEGGETSSVRTGYLPADDGESLEDLLENGWTTPRRVDLIDADDPTAQLFLVIRDNRGGLSWLVRDIEFNDATGL